MISRGYEARIAELEGRYDTLLRDAPDPTAPLFPRCVAMDDDIDLASEGGALSDTRDLGELTRTLQTTMFRNSGRAYRLNDIAGHERDWQDLAAQGAAHRLRGRRGAGGMAGAAPHDRLSFSRLGAVARVVSRRRVRQRCERGPGRLPKLVSHDDLREHFDGVPPAVGGLVDRPGQAPHRRPGVCCGRMARRDRLRCPMGGGGRRR